MNATKTIWPALHPLPTASDPKCDDCKGFIKNWSTAVQHDKMLIANATDYFNGTDFCAAKTPPGGLAVADCQGFAQWFTPAAMSILGQVVADCQGFAQWFTPAAMSIL